MKTNLIVSGATGFVGSSLSIHLAKQKFKITTIGRRNADYTWSELEDVPNGIEAYIHLAGKAHDLKGVSNPDEYFKVNTELTCQFFEKFMRSDARLFIFVSSVKAAADSLSGILTEDKSATPTTPYGKSKLMAEEYLMSKHLSPDKRVVIIRPCMIHGPGNKGNLNLLYNLIKKGIPYPLAAFRNQRSYLFIDNFNFIVSRILEKPSIPSGIYNAADDNSLSTTELVEIIGSVTLKKARAFKVPKSIIFSLAKIGDLLKLGINTHTLGKLTESYVVSNQKLKDSLDLESFPVELKTGIEKTIRSF